MMTYENRPKVERTPEREAGISYTEALKVVDVGGQGLIALATHICFALGRNIWGRPVWQKRLMPDGKEIVLDKFEDYLLLPPREGLKLPSLYTVNQTLASLPDGVGKEALMLIRKEIHDWDERIDREAWKRLEAKETKQGQRIDITSTNCRSEVSQSSRADSNGVGIVTQRKLDRLARDRPDLLELVKANEMSIHAAAKAAGIVKQQSTLDTAKKCFLKLNEVERNEFLSWISEV